MDDDFDSGYGIERRTATQRRKLRSLPLIAAAVSLCGAGALALMFWLDEPAAEPAPAVLQASAQKAGPAVVQPPKAGPQAAGQTVVDEVRTRQQRIEELTARIESLRASLAKSEPPRPAEPQAARAASAPVDDEAAREERAWARFYKRSADCENDPANERAVLCANEYIRARKQFHEAFLAGKL